MLGKEKERGSLRPPGRRGSEQVTWSGCTSPLAGRAEAPKWEVLGAEGLGGGPCEGGEWAREAAEK